VLETIARLDDKGQALIRDAAEAMNLSARGFHRVLRVARTIADLDRREAISRLHLAEALSYRQKPASLRAAA
jgi:magnesium chelatase family protein